MRRIKLKYLLALISSISIVLVVMLMLQVYKLYEKRSEDLNEYIENVLNKVAIRHEKATDLQAYTSFFSEDFSGQYKKALKQEFQNLVPVKESVTIKDTTIFENGRHVKYLQVTGESFDSLTHVTAKHSVLARDLSEVPSYIQKTASDEVVSKDSNDLAFQLDKRVITSLFKKSKYINELMASAFRSTDLLSAEQRINLAFLDSMIYKTFEVENLETSYNYAVTDEQGEIVVFPTYTDKYNLEINLQEAKKIRLFPGNIFDEELTLNVYFPKRKSLLIQDIWLGVFAGVFLVALILLSFYLMYGMLVKQRQLAVAKSDFISNMTHEFKTPISTISLACEAMLDNDMTQNDISTVSPFIKMIDEENKRLGGLVEQILKSTVLDKGEIKMKKENLDLNEITTEVANKAKIRVGEGKLYLDQELGHLPFIGDTVHVNNMVSNLVDNAIKYSKDNIDITIKTEKLANEKYRLSVSDKGIGIKNEHLDKIFDKLYRVPTGNVHDVKGYGLGLNYVKAIVDAHGWDIKVKSKYNEGTTFVVTIYNTKENE